MLKKTTLYLTVLALALLCIKPISAEENKTLRIQELIPKNCFEFPAMAPAIPSDYTLGTFNETGYTLWGTKEDIATFNKNESEIKSEVISIHYSLGVKQTDPTTFSHENELEKEATRMGFKNIKIKKLSWGTYPVLAAEAINLDGQLRHMAWVGLNLAETGDTFFIAVHPPKNGQSDTFWKTFLNNTKQLDEPEFFRAMGMDMKEGYTVYKVESASVKATAEKRTSDGLLAVMIEPLSPNTTYQIDSVFEYPLETKWKNRKPCAKISVTMTEKDGKVDDSVITVLIKEVDDFSFDLDLNHHPKGVVIFQHGC